MNKRKWISLFLSLIVILECLVLAVPDDVYASGEWNVYEDTRIYWISTEDSDRENSDLAAQVQLFDSELAAEKITDGTLPIYYGEKADAGEHDILLLLDGSLNLPKQSYQIEVGTDLRICASDADGLFYGCRYVLQAMMTKSGLTVGTVICDGPDVSERAISLDMARKYYSPDWIIRLMKEMSWSGMNALVLHFSEEMGLRLESQKYPWLAGSDAKLSAAGGSGTVVDTEEGKYITQEEMREIAQAAKLYHIELIPSFDTPGHMNYIVKKYKEHYGTDIGNYYHYNGKTAIVQGSGSAYAKQFSRGIDISNPEAVAFTKDLLTEYAEFFRELGCTKFDLGGDELLGWGTAVVSTSSVSRWKQLDHWKEYAVQQTGSQKAVAYDAFMLYMNDLAKTVKDIGYTSVRMWNDDAYRTSDIGYTGIVPLDKSVDITYWTDSANNSKNTVSDYLKQGHSVYNYLNTYNYYVLLASASSSYPSANAKDIYLSWNPFYFGKVTVSGTQREKVAGSALCIWCDDPSYKTADEVMAGIVPMIRAHGAKAWDSDASASISYEKFSEAVSQKGDAPKSLPAPSEILTANPTDISGLENLIAEYQTMDAEAYTPESFRPLKNAVEEAVAMLAGGVYKQEEIDRACEVINTAKSRLRTPDQVGEENCLFEFSAKSTKVTSGKTLSVAMRTGEQIVDFEVYDENGNRVLPDRRQDNMYLKNTPAGQKVTYFYFKVAQKGIHTYTVYAVDEKGMRSADSMTLTFTCT